MREAKTERERLLDLVCISASEDEPFAASLATELSTDELWQGCHRLADELGERGLRRVLMMLMHDNQEAKEWLGVRQRSHDMKGVLKRYLKTGNPFLPPQERRRIPGVPLEARPEFQAWVHN